jgi:hypothetical protein
MSQQCNRGLQVCDDGQFGACTADSRPIAEACNGVDDDCDGTVDEESDVACYPDGTAGCSKVDKVYVCAGACRVGKQTCTGGQLGACADFTGPGAEVCSGTPADENCDGTIDENCACTGSQPRPCYTGGAGTQNVGKCTGGNQTCTNGTLGVCTGQTTDAPESCANEGADDDCDGMMDNIRDRGTPCVVVTNKGPCVFGTLQCQSGSANLVCVTPAGTTEVCNNIDDDCDGTTDDGFDLMTDEMHCGSCTKACAASETCCGGMCKNTKTDAAFCGGCEAANKCATNDACCNGACKNTKTDAAFCGGCEAANKCAAGSSCCDGLCADTQTDAMHCGAACGACSATQQCCTGQCVGIADAMHCGNCTKTCTGSLTVDGGMESCMCTMGAGNTATCSTASMMACP